MYIGYLNVSLKSKDFKICLNIKTEADQNSCYSSVGKLAKNADACGYIQQKDTKDDCYFSIAQIKQDRAICQKIEDSLGRNICSQPETYGVEPTDSLADYRRGLLNRPSAQIWQEGQAIVRSEIKNDNGANLSWDFRDTEGNNVLQRNARGEYRTDIPWRAKTVRLTIFLDGHYQVISDVLTIK